MSTLPPEPSSPIAGMPVSPPAPAPAPSSTPSLRGWRLWGVLIGGGVMIVVAVWIISATRSSDNNQTPLTTYSYSDIASLPSALDPTTTNNLIDLTSLNVTNDATMSITQPAGVLQINLPADANVVVNYTLTEGVYTVNGGNNPADGVDNVQGTNTWPSVSGGPTLTLTVTLTSGVLTIG